MRLRTLRTSLGLLTLLLGLTQTTQAQSFTVFDAPNASSTFPSCINNGGDVIGQFIDVSQSGKQRGFVRDRNGNISVFDAPDALGTAPESINDFGDVAGVLTEPSASPGAARLGPNYTYRGFVRDRNGNITVFDAPNASSTFPYSINNGGDVTGYFNDASQSNEYRGFVRDRNGNITVFDAPNASPTSSELGTFPVSINAGGDVTGSFHDLSQSKKQRGFVRDRNGNFTVFDAPNASGTQPFSINDGGDVTGQFVDGSQTRGFVRDRNGNITVFDAPNAAVLNFEGTFPFSINDGADITGYFFDASQGNRIRGFGA
jgi:hypothetical protein